MNFFGHAAIARQIDDEPAFILGAMAPDLLAMCGAVAGLPTSPKVTAGERHHRLIDAHLDDRIIRYFRIRGTITPLFFLAAIGLSFVGVYAAEAAWVGAIVAQRFSARYGMV